MSERRKRRRFPAAKKLRIVLAGMQEGVEISELCRREDAGGTATASPRRSGVDDASQRLAGRQDADGVGGIADELLPVAAGAGVDARLA